MWCDGAFTVNAVNGAGMKTARQEGDVQSEVANGDGCRRQYDSLMSTQNVSKTSFQWKN